MGIKVIASTTIPVARPDHKPDEVYWKLFACQEDGGTEHEAWVYGNPHDGALVRVQSECRPGAFGALNCDCEPQLNLAKSKIVEGGAGIVIYMHGHEGLSNGLGKKIEAEDLEQTQGYDSEQVFQILGLQDERNFDAAVAIVQHFGLSRITLLTDELRKVTPFKDAGIEVDVQSCSVELKPVFFWDPKHPLANFYAARIEIGDRTYDSVEHYYQAQKFVGHSDIYNEIANAPDPGTAKNLTHEKYENFIRADWNAVREEVMYRACIAKFTRHEDLRDILLATGNRQLIEDSPDSDYWGVTPDGHGQNRMGIILMRIRNELRMQARSPAI